MWRNLATLAFTVLIPMLTWACGPQVREDGPRRRRPLSAAGPRRAPPRPAPARRLPPRRRPLVVFLGDSLTAGLGLDEDQAYPALVERELEEEGMPVRVFNAGVSGDTTAGGLARPRLAARPAPGRGGRGPRRQRRPARPARRAGREEPARDRPPLPGRRRPRPAARHEDPAQLRPGLHASSRPCTRRIAKELDVPLVPFLLEGVGGDARASTRGTASTPRRRGRRFWRRMSVRTWKRCCAR